MPKASTRTNKAKSSSSTEPKTKFHKFLSAGHDTHVLFQYLLAKKFASEQELQIVHDRVKARCKHIVQSDVPAVMTALNSRLDGINFRLKRVRHAVDGQLYWVFVNTVSDDLARDSSVCTWQGWQRTAFIAIGKAFQDAQAEDGSDVPISINKILTKIQQYRKNTEDLFRFLSMLVQDGWLAETELPGDDESSAGRAAGSDATKALIPGPVFDAELGAVDFHAPPVQLHGATGTASATAPPAASPAAGAQSSSDDESSARKAPASSGRKRGRATAAESSPASSPASKFPGSKKPGKKMAKPKV